MNERLLQFIWQFRYFNTASLLTTEQEKVLIIHPGRYNTNQGPDFLDAKVRIAGTLWAGNIELHVLSGDWNIHGHSGDANYNNVILHVVWEDDRATSNNIPVIELKDRVSKMLLQHYQEMMGSASFIPCAGNILTVSPLTWVAWKERLAIERLMQKTKQVGAFQQSNHNHWEETCWWMTARNFGIRVNAGLFEDVARSIPVGLLAKHKYQLHQLEALLFGQAGLLERTFSEAYPKMLQKEFRFLKQKYKLRQVHKPVHFLRMRPAAFPTIRLAQLAMLVYNSSHLFSSLKEAASIKELRALLDVTANDYWHYHYVFDEGTAYAPKKLGRLMTDNIIINTIVPLLFAYGHHTGDNALKEKALNWLQSAGPEKNSITKGFDEAGVVQKNAFDTQALLQLKQAYCDQKRCLDCAVGCKILSAGGG